ncbi:MAG: tRNA dihydrouridine(20/20a) synthase DusA [Pseudomonadota bacterium]|nr:tRNA dihydrouridine(20/20a) synthase DusA [Pseudomonadota bacterium]
MSQEGTSPNPPQSPAIAGKARKTPSRRFCTAPMMDWSDKHCRYFWRQLTKDTLLYTEMVTTGALIHGNRDRFLEYNDIEHPIALQLGGSNPSELATCSRYAEEWGYDEVNLNVGCPSDRVQNNMIGACLMAHPQLVADCIKAMQDSTSIDVTIKHRIGIDDQDSYEHMRDFVATVAETGCKTFIVHARKAILQGLSPKENREVPPLRYDDVYRLKQEFPDLEIIINGGIKTHKQIAEIMPHVDGVMLGREAYQNPSVLIDADELYFGKPANTESAKDAVRALYPYIETLLAKGAPLHYVSRHILGLFNGQRGARLFRRYLSERAHLRESGIQVLEEALQLID